MRMSVSIFLKKRIIVNSVNYYHNNTIFFFSFLLLLAFAVQAFLVEAKTEFQRKWETPPGVSFFFSYPLSLLHSKYVHNSVFCCNRQLNLIMNHLICRHDNDQKHARRALTAGNNGNVILKPAGLPSIVSKLFSYLILH